MIRERIADDIYVFTSQRYAQVTCGAVLTKEGVVLIDTLFYPEETQAVKSFLEDRLDLRVTYLINTHYHADHTMGNYLFPQARIVGHQLCYELLNSRGREGLAQMKEQTPEFQDVEIVLPDLILEEGLLSLHIGGKTLQLQHMPGHSPDLLSVFVVNDRILFASDNAMPVPTIFDGEYDKLLRSIDSMLSLDPECVVQGHGDVILRGDVHRVFHDDLDYLLKIKKKIETIIHQGTDEELETIGIESCGKSRLPLNGFVTDLHEANLRKLHNDLCNKHK